MNINQAFFLSIISAAATVLVAYVLQIPLFIPDLSFFVDLDIAKWVAWYWVFQTILMCTVLYSVLLKKRTESMTSKGMLKDPSLWGHFNYYCASVLMGRHFAGVSPPMLGLVTIQILLNYAFIFYVIKKAKLDAATPPSTSV